MAELPHPPTTPPAIVERAEARLQAVESSIFRIDQRIEDEHHIAQGRIGAVETQLIELEGHKFGELRNDMSRMLDAIGVSGDEVRAYVDRRLNRTDRMLELLLIDRKIGIPEADR